MDIGERIGCWTVLDGIHGDRVFRVEHAERPGRIAALKVCADPDRADDIRGEIANIGLRLLPDAMPELLDFGEHEGLPYFVMPLGESVCGRGKSAVLAVRTALFLIGCAIDLREKGYIHCDYKPENVGIEKGPDGKERLVLWDWESCRRMSEANVRPGIVGTRYYRSREVEYTGICDERSEIHAIGMCFLAMLPLAKRIVYAPSILLAISPTAFPFGRVRRFEELRGLIVRAPGSFRRAVWIGAGVWKTRIVSKWTALAVVIVLLAFGGSEFADSVRRKRDFRLRHQARIEVKAMVREGYVAYRTGDMASASNLLDRAMRSPHFRQEDYPYFDVRDFYKDACRRLGGE